MTLSLAHRRAILTWRSAEVVNLYLFSLQIYACSNIFSKNIFLQKLSIHVHVFILQFFNSVEPILKLCLMCVKPSLPSSNCVYQSKNHPL